MNFLNLWVIEMVSLIVFLFSFTKLRAKYGFAKLFAAFEVQYAPNVKLPCQTKAVGIQKFPKSNS